MNLDSLDPEKRAAVEALRAGLEGRIIVEGAGGGWL